MAFASGTRTRLPEERSFLVPLAVVVAALPLGLALSRGGILGYALLSLAALTVAAIVFSRHLFGVLLVWVAAEGLAFPFVRYPLNHDVATFDRFVILALGGALLLVGSRAMSRDARRLTLAFGLFTAAYGLRAVLTRRLPPPPGYPQIIALAPTLDWVDHVLLPFIVFAAAARVIADVERWRRAAAALVVLGASIAALGLLEWATGLTLARFSGLAPFVDTAAGVVRVTGPYGDPSAYGGVLLVCLAVTFYWIEAERQPLLGGAAAAIEVLALGPIFTRTVWIAGFVVIVMMLGLRRRASTRTVLVFAYGTVLVGAVYLLTRGSSVVTARVRGSNANVYARVGDYAAGLHIFSRWPVFGAGIEQFVPAQSEVAPAYFNGVRAASSAHDTFLSVLAESGLAGFLPLMYLVYAIGRVVRSWRRAARSREEVLFGVTVLTAVASYLVLSLTFAEIYSSPAAAVLAVVLGAAAGRRRSGGAPREAAALTAPELAGASA